MGPAEGPPDLPAAHAALNLANMISFARLCAVPAAIYLVIDRDWGPAFALFAAAGISDAIDGWLARRHGSTALGAALDPLADKTLMMGMYVTLASIGALPVWLAMLVVFRDVMIVGGVVMLRLYGIAAPTTPLAISKTNTALQIVLVGCVLGLNALGLNLPPLRRGLAALVAMSTAASFGAYVARTVRPA